MNRQRRTAGYVAATAATLAAGSSLMALLAAPAPAQACGGFFCSMVPIDQSGEQIVFSVTRSHVVAHIQIAFQGNAKDFAWVVPVMSRPTIGVGSQLLFTALQQRTQPRFGVQWTFTGGSGFCGGPNPTPGGGLAPPTAATPDSGRVNVVDEREVGPYATVTLQSDDPRALVKWLTENGFTQPPAAEPLIAHYVKNGFLFVALKLKQDSSVGEIQPLVLEMERGEPCVPLILTRVAAIPDMPVLVYVLGEARAFPRNWFHVELNQKKINWLNGGSNYRQVVTQAIDDAAGRGFVTEFAGEATIMKNVLYQPGRWNLTALQAISDPVEFVNALLRMGFPRDQTMQALLRKYIPMPQSLRDRGVTEQQFYNNLTAYRADLMGLRVDAAAFVADLEMRVIEPLRKAQEMFDTQPWLSRLFATVSDDEMTRDPLFIFNPHLPAVSNLHTAKGTAECLPDGTLRNVVLTLENGEQLRFPDGFRRLGQPVTDWEGGKGEPAARRIQLVGSSGPPTNYTMAQARVVDDMLNGQDPESVRSRVIPDGAARAVRGCTLVGGPSGGGSGPPGLVLGLVLAGLVLEARRRRPHDR